jgi:hypothetical protein
MINKLFLSVGAMKSGTTWLYDKLRQHPEIHFSRAKEIHFLAHYYGHTDILSSVKRQHRAQVALERLSNIAINQSNRESAIAWYKVYTSEPVDFGWFASVTESLRFKTEYVADFSNLNCHLSTQDWHDVKSNHVDKLRVLYILRDPIMRIWSHYKFHLQFAKHPLANQPDQDFSLFKRIIDKKWFWRNSCYSKSIQVLQHALDSGEIMIIYFEDMIDRPDSTIRDIEVFLGLEEFNYRGNLSKPKNSSKSTKLPEEWMTYIRGKLDEELVALKGLGYYHPKWCYEPDETIEQ